MVVLPEIKVVEVEVAVRSAVPLMQWRAGSRVW